MNNSISDIILTYLKTYSEDPLNKRSNPTTSTIGTLRNNAEASFNTIINYNGPIPTKLDPRDLDEPFGKLLSSIADLVPDLLISKMTNGYWGSRYLFISSAAASKSSKFVSTIINLLLDRSIYVKTLVLNLIIQWPHLQIIEALPLIEKLSKMKAFQKSGIDRDLLDEAKSIIMKGSM
jgi:hypothetical protein